MVAMAVTVSAIFCNSRWGRPALFIDAILSVGRAVASAISPRSRQGAGTSSVFRPTQ
jgi:hypothetical protein